MTSAECYWSVFEVCKTENTLAPLYSAAYIVFNYIPTEQDIEEWKKYLKERGIINEQS